MSSIHPERLPISQASAEALESTKSKILLGKSQLKKTQTNKNPSPVSPRGSMNRLESSYISQLSAQSSLREKDLYHKLKISSNNRIKQIWDILLELVLAYNILTTSFFLAYAQPTGELLGVDVFCWVLFVIDIPITLLEERFTLRGESINDFRNSFRMYLRGFFFVDVISIIPLGFGGHYEYEYYLRMLRLFKLPSVIDLADGTGLGVILDLFHFSKGRIMGEVRYSFKFKIISSLIKLIVFILFTVYFLGCFWYWFQHKVMNYRYSSDGHSFQQMNVISGVVVEDCVNSEIALASSYFILTTIATIGYGDFLPKNTYEMSFMIFVMLFGVTLFGYITGSVNSSLAFLQDMEHGEDYVGNVKMWLDSVEDSQGKLPNTLRSNIIGHFRYYYAIDRLKRIAKCYWKAEGPEDLVSIEDEYLKTLPESSYYEIIENLFPDILEAFSYYFTDRKFFYAIVPHFQPRRFGQGTHIYKQCEEIAEVYVLITGKVSIGIIDELGMNVMVYMEAGQVIGDFYKLTGLMNRFDYISETLTDALMVPAEVLLIIVKEFFPKVRSNMISIFASTHRNIMKMRRTIENRKSARISKMFSLHDTKETGDDLDEGAMLDILDTINRKNSCFKESLKTSKSTMEEILNFRKTFLSGIKNRIELSN